jgi:dihydroflavonol-4-reductase
MKVFLTGGTGFVGSQVAKRLVIAGHEVRCLVRSANATPLLKQFGVQLARGDLTDKASLVEGMRGCNTVINAGAAYDFWTPDRSVYPSVNVHGTRNVMEAALEVGASKVVHVSTIVVYGKPTTSPVREETPVGPVRFSEYARTKYEGELVAWDLYKSRGLPLVVVYPGAVLGAGDPKATGQYVRSLLLGEMPASVFNDATFPFVHVNDVAEAIVRAAGKENNVGQKYLLTAENLTFGQINNMIAEISGVPLPRLSLPATVAIVTAALLTGIARFTKKPPAWGMSLDQIRTMRHSPVVDGSKAERDLGIRYTPIGQALRDAIESFQARSRA